MGGGGGAYAAGHVTGKRFLNTQLSMTFFIYQRYNPNNNITCRHYKIRPTYKIYIYIYIYRHHIGAF